VAAWARSLEVAHAEGIHTQGSVPRWPLGAGFVEGVTNISRMAATAAEFLDEFVPRDRYLRSPRRPVPCGGVNSAP
jgi:hypothetical protein